ncbi:ABC-2 type transport system ATP-binding protein [Salirhabdus euzebyi]|uniref:ABC-2 type transport system ATP-binding protein n=1 Tax=Salirhabdus euzebyi TaxID=394506 RepID=A0A841QA55_9BACI|nr:ABC transporter ATP-binding protein [Salirhabdus euzebyi]MBB6455401.1 ABC-2 type transport system ATP-binding protein [Salirhabdus euzebyi]
MSNNKIVQITNVSFYHDQNQVIRHINLEIEQNGIYGLWGRNGAGKTTLMKLLTGLIKPDAGNIKVFGERPFENRNVLQNICFIQENHPLNPQWRIYNVLTLGKYFYKNWDESKANIWLERFSLHPKAKVKSLSKGMRTALSIVIGMASNCPLTIFDEPTNGLDAATREIFYEGILKEYENIDNRTFVMSTHHISEWQRMIGNIIVLNEGEILLNDEIDHIQSEAVYLSGSIDDIKPFIVIEEILEEKTMGNMGSFMVERGSITQKMDRSKVTIESVPLQDYLLRKTQKKKVVHL